MVLIRAQSQSWSPDRFLPSTPSAPVLRLLQAELAIIRQSHSPSAPPIVASTDATTCLVLCARVRQTGTVALAHADGPASTRAFVRRVSAAALRDDDGGSVAVEVDVWVVGGYVTARGDGAECVAAFEEAASGPAMSRVVFCVRGMRVGRMNARGVDGGSGPRWTGLGIEVAGGDAFCAEFDGSGMVVPGFLRRSGRLWLGLAGAGEVQNGDSLEEVWGEEGVLRLGALHCDLSDGDAEWQERLLRVGEDDDGLVLRMTSTTPEWEAKDFCACVRATIRWMLAMCGKSLTEERYEWQPDGGGFVKLPAGIC
jgi:Protein N-terminal asparagine amidohydrolase